MKRVTSLALLCGLAVMLGRATCAQAANEERAKQLIEAQASTILRAAHPLGKFNSLACDQCTKTASGYDLTYTFGWIGKKTEQFRTTLDFSFAFNGDGKIDHITIVVKDDTSGVEPFKLGKLAVRVLKGFLKSKLKEHLSADVARQVGEEVDKIGDAKDLLAFWLKHVGNKKA